MYIQYIYAIIQKVKCNKNETNECSFIHNVYIQFE